MEADKGRVDVMLVGFIRGDAHFGWRGIDLGTHIACVNMEFGTGATDKPCPGVVDALAHWVTKQCVTRCWCK